MLWLAVAAVVDEQLPTVFLKVCYLSTL